MCTSDIQAGEDPVRLDVCQRCALVWFDGGEFEIVRDPLPPTAPSIPRANTRTLAALRLGHLTEPFVTSASPLASWCTIALIVFIGVFGLVFMRESIESDTVAAAPWPWRRGSHIVLSLLHANPVHLVLEVLGLWIAAPVIEDWFGRRGYLVLVSSCIFLAPLGHVSTHGSSLVIGAAPLVAGLWTALVLVHPRARIDFLPSGRCGAPAWVLAAAWLACQWSLTLAGLIPATWTAIGVGVVLGALCSVVVQTLDGALPGRSPF